MEKLKFIIEAVKNNYSCYSEDIPGVVATGRNLSEIKKNAVDAMEFHIEGCRKDGDELPEILRVKYELVFQGYP